MIYIQYIANVLLINCNDVLCFYNVTFSLEYLYFIMLKIILLNKHFYCLQYFRNVIYRLSKLIFTAKISYSLNYLIFREIYFKIAV